MLSPRWSLVIAVALLSLAACSSSAEDEPSASPCKTELYQLKSLGRKDPEAKAPAVVCEESSSRVRAHSRIDVIGDNLCPGFTEGLDPEPDCRTNADCAAQEVCACSLVFGERSIAAVPTVGSCIARECSGPGDCGGRQCGLSTDRFGVPEGLFCRTAADECESDLECGVGRTCNFGVDHWACEDFQLTSE